MPQLDPSSFASQLFWLVITFSLLYVVLARFVLPNISKVLQVRQERITNDLDKAEAIRKEAELIGAEYESSLLEARTKAQATIAEALKKVEQEAQARRDELDVVLQKKISDADNKLEAARESTLNKLKPAAAELVTLIVAEVSNLRITQKQAEEAVNSVTRNTALEKPAHKLAAGE